MRRVSIIVGIVVMLGAIAVGAVATTKARQSGEPAPGAAAFEPAESAELVAAREVSWQPTADLVGTVFAIRSVTVRNELAGVVRFIGFDSGQIVEQGQVLLRQDDTTERADLEAVKAAVRVAEANIAQSDTQIALAEVELNRLKSVQSRAIAEVELDRAKARLDSVRADRGKWLAEADQARARVNQVEARMAKLTIHAPFRARAGLRTVHEGQYLAEGADIVVLQELTDTIYLDFAIPQEYAPRVQADLTVMATGELLGPDPVAIKVVAVDSAVNYDTRNLRVRAVVDNARGVLVPGMFVEVRVPIDEARKFIAVPNMAVRRAAYANSVFVVGPDEHGVPRAKQRFVTLGQTLGEDVIVLDGLKAGEVVAASGAFKLRDGVKMLGAETTLAGPEAAPAAAASSAE